MSNELKVSFYLKREGKSEAAVANPNEIYPIVGKIIIGKTIAQFGSKLKIEESLWNVKAGRASGKSRKATELNREINFINLSIHHHYKDILERTGKVTATDVKNAFQGIASAQGTLLAFFDELVREFHLRVGIDRAHTTYLKYTNTYNHLKQFVRIKYKVEDIPLNQLDLPFIEAFALYLRVERKMQPESVNGRIILLQKAVKVALYRGLISRPPFFGYKPEKCKVKIKSLTAEEFERILSTPIERPTLMFVRDMFVFSTFTGMSYSDVRKFTWKDLVKEEDGSLWISMCRQKTDTPFNVKLLDIPIQIIEKYRGMGKDDKVFPMIALTNIDTRLKILAKLCEINKPLAYHWSRHTFASQICLSQGVPIETVSQMMGHRDIHTTQRYARVNNDKIASDMKKLSARVADTNTLMLNNQRNTIMQANRSTFGILFYLNTSKAKKSGKCPIVGRVSVDGKNTAFSTGLDVLPEQWNTKSGLATGKSKDTDSINRQIENYKTEITNHYKNMVSNNGYVTAEYLKNALRGIGTRQNTLLQEFSEYLDEFRKSVGVNKVYSSYRMYLVAYNHLKEFIRLKYGVDDMAFGQIDFSFVEAYDYYLKIDRGITPRTVEGNVLPFRRVVRRAINKGMVRQDPFFNYVPTRVRPKRRWLSSEEIERIMTTPIAHRSANFVRDMFILSCWTGLSYVDVRNLKESNIKEMEDGSKWIVINRQKTGTPSYIPLLDISMRIIEKYRGTGKDGKLFHLMKNSEVNLYLKTIAKAAGIDKRLTYHMSRFSFATTVCLSQGVPIESLSQMMGHKNIKTTQIYAEVTKTKINEDMTNLEKRIEGKYELAGIMSSIKATLSLSLSTKNNELDSEK